jgi:CheY-like chemotaxis protein
MAPSLAGIRIIVVEPHDDMRELLDQSLRLLGARVCPRGDPRDAADRMSEADIILTDVAMPGEDGLWLWEQVNSQFPHIPVVALTGYTVEQYPRITQAKFAHAVEAGGPRGSRQGRVGVVARCSTSFNHGGVTDAAGEPPDRAGGLLHRPPPVWRPGRGRR